MKFIILFICIPGHGHTEVEVFNHPIVESHDVIVIPNNVGVEVIHVDFSGTDKE